MTAPSAGQRSGPGEPPPDSRPAPTAFSLAGFLGSFWLRLLLILASLIAAIHLAELGWNIATRFADIILVFFLAWLVSFILAPVVRLLRERSRLPNLAAIGIVYLAVLVVLAVTMVLVAPLLVQQLANLAVSIPTYLAPLPSLLDEIQRWLGEQGVEVNPADLYNTAELSRQAQAIGTAIAQNALAIAQGIAGVIFNLVLILVLSFYMLLDGPRLASASVGILPPNYQADAHTLMESISRTFGGFIRGLFVQAILYGLGTALIMAVAGLDFLLPVSFFAGSTMFIPFLGPLLGAIPPIVIALFTGDAVRIIVTIAGTLLLQQVVLNIIGPKVMGDAVGLHPMIVLLALLIGLNVAGVWGALFAIPIAAVLSSMALSIYRRRRYAAHNGVYTGK